MTPEQAIAVAFLTERQIAFRGRKKLHNALPYTVWGFMWFRLKPGQRKHAASYDGDEPWFTADQVCREDNAPTPPPHLMTPTAIRKFFHDLTPAQRDERHVRGLIAAVRSEVIRANLPEATKQSFLRPTPSASAQQRGVPEAVLEARRAARKALVRQGRLFRRA
jgi:hypothetical protein